MQAEVCKTERTFQPNLVFALLNGAMFLGRLATAYVSFMICPPLIGWLADLFSLQTALLTLGLSGVVILLLAREVRWAQNR
ncbi:hypothetical protein HY230_03815 [Candidatus Acetothermia bacterium]|nr:hypothetical protein [Candidatus Acetothermia bacterium]